MRIGNLDSRVWVRLVTWVNKNNPEMMTVVQKRKDSNPVFKEKLYFRTSVVKQMRLNSQNVDMFDEGN